MYVEATNRTSGSTMCKSVRHGEMGHVMSMSTCTSDPLALVRRDDVIEVQSVYDSPEARDDVMGIMLMYVHRTSLE